MNHPQYKTPRTASLSLVAYLANSARIIASCALICASDAYAKASVPGLIGHWKFDEPAREVAADSSGRDHHGKLRGAVRTAGKIGAAIECKQDALVEIPHAASLDELKGGITVSAWIIGPPMPTWNMVVSREVKEGPSEYFGLAVMKNKALFSVDPDGAHYQN